MNPNSKNTFFEKEINGLRGVAILLVVLFHYEIFPFSGGFIGVDIFFVISGYLITKIIINKKYSDLNYINFVKNRIRRIFPGLIFMILLSIPLFFLILSPNHLEKFANSIISNIFFLPNFYFWTQSNYFDLSSSFKPLLHTWSLGIEFHFYFLWPFLFIFLYKLTKKKIILNLSLISLIILSIIFLEILIKKGPVFENKFLYGIFVSDTIFFLSPFRIFEFIFGSLLAINLKRIQNNFYNEILFIFGVLIILFSSIYIDEKFYFPSIIALLPLTGTFILIFSKDSKYSAYLLRNNFINFFGNISYSLYLYHWPVYIFFKYYKFSELDFTEKLSAFLISLILSYFSYNFIERYYLNKKNKIFDKKLVTSAVFVFIISLTINFNNGFNFRLNDESQKVLNNKLNNYGGLCLKNELKNYKKKDRCLIGNQDNLDFLLVGDSHGKALTYGLKTFAKKNNFNFSTFEDMCQTYPNLNSNIKSCNIEEKIPKNIIIGKKFYDYQIEDNKLDEISRQYMDKIKSIILNDKFKNLENIIVIGQVPEFYSSYGDALSCYARPQIIVKKNCENFLNKEIYSSNYSLKENHRFKQKKILNQNLKKYASFRGENNFNIIFFDPFDYFCEELKCEQVIDGNLIYSDSTHLSKYGSNYLISKIEKELLKVIK